MTARLGSSSFRLPRALTPGSECDAVELLRGYFDTQALYSGAGFTGALFDTWDPTGVRASSRNEFTADDLQAVAFLSADIGPRAAIALLGRRASEFNELLAAVGDDRDLVEEADVLDEPWPATVLNRALRTLPGVGATRASKLIARKRPRLVPIFDSVVNDYVLGGSGVLWEPMRWALRRDNAWLHDHLLAVRDAAGLGPEVSALRVFDVIAWREGMQERPPRS